ncbi:MAG TPA: AAA family ATPase, partial [Treponema sp.]|nr:AAA family ATPase [Treponema sp.]
PVLLILDEAWLFLKNPIFSAKIVDWLKTLRKKHVFCVFATQEIDDAANSPIASTLVSQCMSKIFLADPDISPIAKEAYKKFGLEDAEIKLISESQMKKDYYYKSPSGTRLFQLDLDALQLALLTTDHAVCDAIEEIHGRNSREELALEILDKKQIDYTHVYQGR